MSLAIIKLSQNKSAAAEEILKEAVAKAPLSVEARIGLSELYGALHKLDDAERSIRRALEIDPRNGTALLFLARVQQAKGQEAQVDQTLRRLSSLPDKEFRPLRALYLLQTGNLPAAISNCNG